MPDLEVNIFNHKLRLSYKENEKQRILKAVDELNNSWNKFSNLHGKVSDLKIATLISLELQDLAGDIKVLKDKINFKESDNKNLKKENEFIVKESTQIKKNINKLQSELNDKNQEISKIENTLDHILTELLEIKNSFGKNE